MLREGVWTVFLIYCVCAVSGAMLLASCVCVCVHTVSTQRSLHLEVRTLSFNSDLGDPQ